MSGAGGDAPDPMHPNPAFRAGDDDAMMTALGAIAFGRIFLTTPEGPRVAHAPLLVAGSRRLRFHLANKNALVPHLAGATALILAEGPRGYISANWYPDPRGAVPTWNYVAIEAEGVVAPIDRAGLADLLDDLAAELEPRVVEDWTRAKMDAARFEAMLGAITGYEMTVTALRGTHKLSQNQPYEIAMALAAHIERTGDGAIAQAMRSARA